MKKKSLFIFLFLFLFIFGLASCKTEEARNPSNVDDIIGTIDESQYGKKPEFSCSCPKTKLVVGESLDIIPEFGEGVTNKALEWSSSNTEVLSVSNGKVTANQLGEATITVSAFDGKNTKSFNFEVVKKAALTLMVYICGSDLGFQAIENITSMIYEADQPEDVNVIIQTGGAKDWEESDDDNLNLSTTNIERRHIRDNKIYLDETLPNTSMGSITCYKEFLKWGINEYPAERTGVIMWNHGGGMFGCCFDNNYEDRLTTQEAHEALEKAFQETNRKEKLEFIAYDACVMAVQDVAEMNSHYFNYMLGSTELSYLWDYSYFMDDVYLKKDTKELLKCIADGYMDTCYNDGINLYIEGITMSCLDLSQIEGYRLQWEAMSKELYKKLSKEKREEFCEYVNKSINYGDFQEVNGQMTSIHCLYDPIDFLRVLSTTEFNPGEECIKNIKEALDKVVIYNRTTTSKNSCGLSMFYATNDSARKSTYYTPKHTAFLNWQIIVDEFGY